MSVSKITNYLNVTGNRFQQFMVTYLMSETLPEFQFYSYFVYMTIYVPSCE
jgi:hypothetical protein